MNYEEARQEELSKRLTRGREARQILENPLIEGFFKERYTRCFKDFCELPEDSPIEKYQAAQQAYLALQHLHDELQGYITRAETDIEVGERDE